MNIGPALVMRCGSWTMRQTTHRKLNTVADEQKNGSSSNKRPKKQQILRRVLFSRAPRKEKQTPRRLLRGPRTPVQFRRQLRLRGPRQGNGRSSKASRLAVPKVRNLRGDLQRQSVGIAKTATRASSASIPFRTMNLSTKKVLKLKRKTQLPVLSNNLQLQQLHLSVPDLIRHLRC